MAREANILEGMSYFSCHRRQNVSVLRGERINNDRQITCIVSVRSARLLMGVGPESRPICTQPEC